MSDATPEPNAQPPEKRNFWQRRSPKGKIGIVAAAILIAAAIGGSVGNQNSDKPTAGTSPSTTVTVTTTTAATDTAPAETTATVPEVTPTTEPPPQPPRPRSLAGTGSRVLDVRLFRDSPLIVTGQHSGSSNFIVDLVPRDGGSEENLFNEIGSFRGQKLASGAATGRYRVKVQADGRWSLRFAQPVPLANATQIPGTIKGRGALVVPVQASEDFQAVITGSHRGQSNFIVDLVGYGGTTGQENLYNEIGVFSGETLVDVPAGSLLLSVQADGTWSIRFSK
jgi:hypothetical protein